MLAVLVLAASLAIPKGAWDYCQRSNDTALCDNKVQETTVPFSSDLHRLMFNIHAEAMVKIRFEDDQQHYKTADYWTVPTDGKGDCEDYALWEAHKLIEAGVAPGALSIAVVESGEHVDHAVLMVHTPKTDFIMDSMIHEIVPASGLNFRMVKLSSGNLLNWRRENTLGY